MKSYGFLRILWTFFSLRLGHLRGKTVINCFLTLSGRFATPFSRLDVPLYASRLEERRFFPKSNVYFAGQMTGVEGYIESASSGFVAGVNASRRLRGLEEVDFTDRSVIGALSHFVNNGGFSGNFQPMNANFGIVAPLDYKVKGGKKARNEEIAKRALSTINELKGEILK